MTDTTPPGTASPPPLVSIIIPAYNRAGSIRAAIESVLGQSWGDFELIVVDDGSTDATLEEAAKISDPRLRLVESPQNGGAAAARNRGVAEARGTWIAFQDSDDEWLPTKLEKQMAKLLAPGADFIAAYCGLLTLGWLDDAPGARLQVRYRPGPAITPAEGDISRPLLYANMISTQTMVVRRDVFFALGRFDEDTTPIEDWDFVIRMAQTGAIAFVDEPLVHQRFSANSITRNGARRLSSRIRVVEKNLDIFTAHPDMLARQYQIIGNSFRADGDAVQARRYLGLACRLRPRDAGIWGRWLQAVAQSCVPGRAAAGPRALAKRT